MDRDRPPRPALIVHAGAWAIPPSERPAHRQACRDALEAGWGLLARGGTARDAVVAAIETFEADEAVNAGAGSVLCRDGWVEMDAALMDGTDLEVGAVTGVRDHRHPIRVAREVLASRAVLLAGEGAASFARERGLACCDGEDLVVARERERLADWRRRRARRQGSPGGPGDTVGAVAVDAGGTIVAGASSGGRCGKRSGRVGDVAVPGAGIWADNRAAGVACTGDGEPIVRLGLARRAADLAREMSAQDACWMALRELRDRVGGSGGLVMIARDLSIGYAFDTPAMPLAYRDEELDGPVEAGLDGPAA